VIWSWGRLLTISDGGCQRVQYGVEMVVRVDTKDGLLVWVRGDAMQLVPADVRPDSEHQHHAPGLPHNGMHSGSQIYVYLG